MNPRITVEPAESVPDDAEVRHYDELAQSAKQQLPAVVEGGERLVDDETAVQFTDGEFVKFTGYYRVRLAR